MSTTKLIPVTGFNQARHRRELRRSSRLHHFFSSQFPEEENLTKRRSQTNTKKKKAAHSDGLSFEEFAASFNNRTAYGALI